MCPQLLVRPFQGNRTDMGALWDFGTWADLPRIQSVDWWLMMSCLFSICSINRPFVCLSSFLYLSGFGSLGCWSQVSEERRLDFFLHCPYPWSLICFLHLPKLKFSITYIVWKNWKWVCACMCLLYLGTLFFVALPTILIYFVCDRERKRDWLCCLRLSSLLYNKHPDVRGYVSSAYKWILGTEHSTSLIWLA